MNRPVRTSVLVGCLIAFGGGRATAQWLTQEVPLRAGWNAVYLRVQPYPASCDTQLAGTPVAEVHRYYQRVRVAQFDTDPSKPFRRPAEWLTWRPDDGTNRFVRTLDALTGDTTYLIRATNPVTLRIVGRPVIPRRQWVPGIPNLVGFQIDPAPGAQPTFAAFFGSSPGVPVVGGPEEGLVQEVDANLNGVDLTSRSRRLTVAPGKAYWIRARSHSHFVGPLEVRTVNAHGLFFEDSLHELPIWIKNTSDATVTAAVRHVASDSPPAGLSPRAGAVPLHKYSDESPRSVARESWPVGATHTRSLAPGEEWRIRLAIDRGAMGPTADPAATWQSLLRVQGAGMEIHVPVGAYRSGPRPAAGRLAQSGPPQNIQGYPAGLWIGEALIDQVSYSGPTNDAGLTDSSPRPVPKPFPLRLIVHQEDAGGACRLLSQVLVVGTPTTVGTNTNLVVSLQVGWNNYVPQASDVVLARVTSPAFGGARVVPMTDGGGTFLQGTVAGTFLVDESDPMNPFRHLYHPQHTDGIALTHTVTLSDWSSPEAGQNPQAATFWNPEETVNGDITQTIAGFGPVPIQLSGKFTLKRVSTIATLGGIP